jgi:hypothetical protein
MSNHFENSRVPTQGSVVVSLVAAVACTLASDARASWPQTNPSIGEQELSARVATIVERIRVGDPALLRDVQLASKVAQFGNR